MNNPTLLTIPGTGVIIDVANNNYILPVKDNNLLQQIITAVPGLYTQVFQDCVLVVLPIHIDTLKLLRNLGFDTTGMEPFSFQYQPPLIEGRYPVMAHQLTSAAFMSSRSRCFNTSTPRTGKTGSTVLAIDYLQSTGQAKGAALIVSTVSSLQGVWARTITETFPHRHAVVVHGGIGKKARIKGLKEYADYYIINYDGLKMVEAELTEMVNTGRISIVVFDELSHYGNTKSARWIAANHVVNGRTSVPFCWGLTGSPGADELAVFGFVKLVNPDKMSCQRLSTWRDMVQFRFGREAWMWRKRSDAGDVIHRVMQPNIRFKKEDIMDLPPIIYQTRDCELTKEQHTAYEQMKHDMIMVAQSGEVVQAVHKSSLSHKLFQISLGCVIDSDGSVIHLDNSNRMKVLLEIIEETDGKFVIFCPYTGVINRLVADLRKHNLVVEKVDGSVVGKKRTEIFRKFMDEEELQGVICHPETTAFSVELASASTMIYYGPPLSGGFIYEQSLERLSSMKQKADHILCVQLVATPEERKFFAGLDSGTKASTLINNMFAEITKKSS